MIIKTLLMGDDPGSIDLYSDADDITISKEPFLYGQVVDQTGQPIRWEGRATKFADYLLQTRLKSRSNGLKIIYSVTINLVPNHLDKRAHKYLGMVRQASRKYGVDESLILAIMQTESSFNPYAVSRSDALGLMQVVQHSAGKDVFRAQGKSGTPSRSYLFDPQSNIDTGTAYLAMLNNVYLGGIDNPTSRRYAVITAYNGARAACYASSRTTKCRPQTSSTAWRRGMFTQPSPLATHQRSPAAICIRSIRRRRTIVVARKLPLTLTLSPKGRGDLNTHTKMLFASQSKLQINVDCIFCGR